MKIFSFFMLLLLCVAPISAEDADAIAKRSFESSLELRTQGKPEQALQGFEQVYTQFPKSPYADDALFELAKHYYPPQKIGEFSAPSDPRKVKTNYLDKILTEHIGGDKAPEALVMLGAIYLDPRYDAPNLNEAYACFLRAIRIYPQSKILDSASFGLCYILYLQKNYEQTARAFEKFLLDYPRSEYAPRAYFYLAKCLAKLKRNTEAFYYLKQLKTHFPNSECSAQAADLTDIIARSAFPRSYEFVSATVLKANADIRRVSVLRVASDGSLLAVGSDLKLAGRFDADGDPIQTYDASSPEDITEATDGGIYIANRENIVKDDGSSVHIYESSAKEDIRYRRINAVAVTSRREIIASDTSRSAMVLAGEDGRVLRHLLKANADFLICDENDDIWLLDRRARTVMRITSEGATVKILKQEKKEHQPEAPVAFDMDALGNMYVIDARKNAVLIFDSDLNYRASITSPAKGAEGEFRRLTAIAVSPSGTVYLFDETRGEILRYE